MTQDIQNSVNQIIEKLMHFSHRKNLGKVMELYDNSNEFKFISSHGNLLTFTELEELYKNLFENLESVKLLKSEVAVTEINSTFAYCLWQGKEQIKMNGTDEVESSWTATILFHRSDKYWKILHFHVTHF